MKSQGKKTVVNVMPLGDRVLIREEQADEKETKTKSGIIIPVTAHEDKGAKQGEVVAVGPGRVTDDGKLIAPKVKTGDSVLFQWGDKIKVDGEEYYIVRESEIIGIVK